jgi:DNA-binding transcriptional regulator YdaS (Cro superfamily)
MPDSQKKILEGAAKLLGRVELAKALSISESQLNEWMAGESEMPASKFKSLSALLVAFAKKT